MSNSDSPADPSRPSASVVELIGSYRRQREIWLTQARDVARLRSDALAAAEAEAARILAANRADIGRVVAAAHRGLLELAAVLAPFVEPVHERERQIVAPRTEDHPRP